MVQTRSQRVANLEASQAIHIYRPSIGSSLIAAPPLEGWPSFPSHSQTTAASRSLATTASQPVVTSENTREIPIRGSQPTPQIPQSPRNISEKVAAMPHIHNNAQPHGVSAQSTPYAPAIIEATPDYLTKFESLQHSLYELGKAGYATQPLPQAELDKKKRCANCNKRRF